MDIVQVFHVMDSNPVIIMMEMFMVGGRAEEAIAMITR